MSGPNYTKWTRKAFWHLDEGVALLLRVDPKELKEVRNSRSRLPREWREFIEEYEDMLETAHRCERLEFDVLTYTVYSAFGSTYAEVKPTVFLNWAKSKGYEIPVELNHVLSQFIPEEKQDVSTWGYGHDTKLLKIVREVIEQYWEEKDPNSAPSKDAIILELKEKYPDMSDSEARAIDLITRHDELRKTKL